MGDYKTIMKQIENKIGKLKKFKKHNIPRNRKFGKGSSVCRMCGRKGVGIINKYGLHYCRQCFREVAAKIGFKKYS